MQLCYRGIAYDRQVLTIPHVETDTVARFRGASYRVTTPVIDQPLQQANGVVYRGVNGQPCNVRFLGRGYQYQPIVFTAMSAKA